MSPAARKSIGAFEVERELGKGGMGVVYLARQPALDRRVVIKGLRRDLSEDDQCEERFRREAQAAAAVHHQNVVSVYDYFLWRGERFISQEFVDGVDLATALELARRFEPRIAALIALELARGLEEIHSLGIVHRDLKPSNILLGRAGEVKIADFGIALDGKAPGLTQTGHAVGTPAYMSPEQFLGERVDTRSDLFTFGTLLYEMLTGLPPFRADDESDGLLRQMEGRQYTRVGRVAGTTPRTLRRLVRRCLQPRARKRMASALDLRFALERHLGSPTPADCRAEISAWLWAQQVFEALDQDDATRLATPVVRKTARLRWRWALAAIAASSLFALSAATNWIDVTRLPFVAEILKDVYLP